MEKSAALRAALRDPKVVEESAALRAALRDPKIFYVESYGNAISRLVFSRLAIALWISPSI
ncbi:MULTISPECIES: hypothetical protein [Pseudanabaena]|uniref:Uncharacterized protein n=1 Tax=Pseudanabaena catenata USMAC16 TaxID=1855837 RepID=A0A9X4RH91_9CYAN|nr:MULTISPECIES: hypothetical protein [Pseudanabaena]MDG3494236.1 hypothetical protein [Pseudanabaena catenata USMAC16]